MGQSATLYRITQNDFDTLKLGGRKIFRSSVSPKEYVVFQKTFMGLEFVLSKDRTDEEKLLFQQIFNPNQSVGGKDYSDLDLDAMDDVELINLFDDDTSIQFNSPETVKLIEGLLSKISSSDFITKFDPDELNSNQVYPWVWNRDTDPDTGFNEQDILNEFSNLKNFYLNAAKESDFVLCFVG